ncbi:hypothetical protein ABEB36_011513 [Hypothenemus hampei]|uniref:Aspartyl/asparaginy/proline hydroxylase domain-containing protein n=1 Tax=Hypothenemus hampei TaxID=57062 RepID=A0ABD1EJU7_HYPHA
MSGDVQPRKRKDKKKKKEEDALGPISSSEDQNIHVHKDGGTGGNICAKIVFFFLFSALIVLIGLIIKENQGLNELESIEQESRFSQIFEGWIDKGVDEHGEEEEQDQQVYSSELTHDHEDEEDDQLEQDPEDGDINEDSEETDETNEETRQSEEEIYDISDDNDNEEREDIAENQSKEFEESDDSMIEESVEETENVVDEHQEEENEGQPQEEQEEIIIERSGVATKVGVGLALLTVAYNVFLRKRRSDSEGKLSPPTQTEKEPTPDLSRRNTLIPPPTLQEVEQDLPEIESEDEEHSDEEYSDEDSPSEHRSPRDEYQELRTTYSRSLTPKGDFLTENTQFERETLEDELEEDSEEDENAYDEDEDEELLKRLEAKYGKLGRDVNIGEEEEPELPGYENSDITNQEDYAFKEKIDAAQEQLDKNAAFANKMFEELLDQHPFSPRAIYGKARALDNLAEQKQSNELVKQALSYYLRLLNAPDVPDKLFVCASERFINRARFMGQYKKAVAVHWLLIERFPDNATYLNNLAVTYLTVNLVSEARSVLQRVLSKWPDDGFALVHYGFILKTADNNLNDSIMYMSKGLKTNAPGVIDGRFFFHLGDALTRINRKDDAMKLYEKGVEKKVFLSKYQRSLYNVDRLTGKPWWDPKDLAGYQMLFKTLKNNYAKIRQEGLSALNDQGYFQHEIENLKDTGTWKQLELFARGQKSLKNCAKSPITCSIIQMFPEASGCKRGQAKFSVMHPGTHVWPHCGPTNCRLRVHLGLKIPSKTFIRVAEETRSWKEGDLIIFDDSFEHEVWHNGSDIRLVLIVDVWHPELSFEERRNLSPI